LKHFRKVNHAGAQGREVILPAHARTFQRGDVGRLDVLAVHPGDPLRPLRHESDRIGQCEHEMAGIHAEVPSRQVEQFQVFLQQTFAQPVAAYYVVVVVQGHASLVGHYIGNDVEGFAHGLAFVTCAWSRLTANGAVGHIASAVFLDPSGMFAGFAYVSLPGVAIAEFLPTDESGRRQGRTRRHERTVEFLHVVFLLLPGRRQFYAVVSQFVRRGKEFAQRSWVPAGTVQSDLHGLESVGTISGSVRSENWGDRGCAGYGPGGHTGLHDGLEKLSASHVVHGFLSLSIRTDDWPAL